MVYKWTFIALGCYTVGGSGGGNGPGLNFSLIAVELSGNKLNGTVGAEIQKRLNDFSEEGTVQLTI